MTQPADYAAELAGITRRHGTTVLLPMTDASLEAVLEHRSVLPAGVVLPFPNLAIYRAASDKGRLLTLARDCGYGVPETRTIATPGDRDVTLPDDFFPAVVKPHRSVVTAAGIRRKLLVTPVADAVECRRALAALPAAAFPVLVQRRVSGVGEGFFALRWGGRTIAMFAHRRLREKPPSGGVSTYRESIPLDERLAGPGLRLLDALDWQGVAMIECKREHETGRQVVMEINGRFWGSLQLAIDAGVDFPWLLYQLGTAGAVQYPAGSYEVGVRSRWWIGDLDHLLLRLRKSDSELSLPPGSPSKGETIASFLRVWDPKTKSEVFRLSDPRPGLHELANYGTPLMRRLGASLRARAKDARARLLRMCWNVALTTGVHRAIVRARF